MYVNIFSLIAPLYRMHASPMWGCGGGTVELPNNGDADMWVCTYT